MFSIVRTLRYCPMVRWYCPVRPDVRRRTWKKVRSGRVRFTGFHLKSGPVRLPDSVSGPAEVRPDRTSRTAGLIMLLGLRTLAAAHSSPFYSTVFVFRSLHCSCAGAVCRVWQYHFVCVAQKQQKSTLSWDSGGPASGPVLPDRTSEIRSGPAGAGLENQVRSGPAPDLKRSVRCTPIVDHINDHDSTQ